MAMLFYGTLEKRSRKRCLYGARLQLLESQVFDYLKINDLAPYGKAAQPYIANFWHITPINHTALSWNDQRGIEQTVFIPGLHSHQEALALARGNYPTVVPSPLVFRFNNEDWIMVYGY